MSIREDMIEAIEEYGHAWAEYRVGGFSDLHGPAPTVEQFVGHLLPNDQGVPPWMTEANAWQDGEYFGTGPKPSWPVEPLYRFRPCPNEEEPVDE